MRFCMNLQELAPFGRKSRMQNACSFRPGSAGQGCRGAAGDLGFFAKAVPFARILGRMKLFLPAVLFFAMASAAFAGTFRVTYTASGLVQRINVQAESSQEARNTVQDLFPGSYVTGAFKVSK